MNCNHLLRSVGSSQIQRASAGDTIWIVTLTEGFELGLAGRLLVGDVVPKMFAELLLETTDLWDSEFHALAEVGTEERMKGVGLGLDASKLRFVDGQPDRFLIRDGQITPNQLKRMRELDSRSARLMQEIWLTSV